MPSASAEGQGKQGTPPPIVAARRANLIAVDADIGVEIHDAIDALVLPIRNQGSDQAAEAVADDRESLPVSGRERSLDVLHEGSEAGFRG